MGMPLTPGFIKSDSMKSNLMDTTDFVHYDTAGNKQRKAEFGITGTDTSAPRWTDMEKSVSYHELGSIFSPHENSIIGWANARIAEAFKVQYAIGVTSGTSGANSTIMRALLEEGKPVMLQRDSHVSLTNAVADIGAKPVWIGAPRLDPDLKTIAPPTLSDIIAAFEREPSTGVVVLTFPSYHGFVGEHEAIIAECHKHGALVFVDAAHGALHGFHPAMPTPAVAAGADVVTVSVHKATEAYSQASVILIPNENLVPAIVDALNSDTSHSTSFNVPTLESLERAVLNLARLGESRIEFALELAEYFRERLGPLAPAFRTWGAEQAGRRGFSEFDATRVTVDVSKTGLTGFEFVDLLQKRRAGLPPVIAEMGDLRNVLFLVSWGNLRSDVDVVIAHLELIAEEHGRPPTLSYPPPPDRLHEQAMTPGEATRLYKAGKWREIDALHSIGEVSAETVAAYPPGWALIVKGERIPEEVVVYLREVTARGGHLKGASDKFKTVKVLI